MTPTSAATTTDPRFVGSARTARRVLVIDDHPVFRLGLAALLREQPDGVDVVEADRADQGLQRWREGTFDLVTVDLSLPDGDGFTLLQDAHDEGLRGIALIVSMHDDAAYHVRARALGAGGYANKAAGPAELAACIARMLRGHDSFQLVGTRAKPIEAAPAGTKELLALLTPTEKRIVALLGRSLTSREIAGMLGSSVRTVENHRANICKKLSLRGPHRLLELALTAVPLLDSVVDDR